MKYNRLSDYNNIHLGKTIFIIGNGQQLDNLTPNQIYFLENNISIGTNASYISVESPYYIAGHMSVMLLTCHFPSKPSHKIFQGEPQHYPFPDEWNLISIAHQKIVGPPGFFPTTSDNQDMDHEILVGAENIGLSSTHLACIMGASKIVYIGFDFKNNAHFYDINRTSYNKLKSNVEEILDIYSHDKFIHDDIMDYYNAHNLISPLTDERISHLRTQEFLSSSTPVYNSMLGKFTAAFNTFKQRNIEIISTQEDSIITEAGAKFVPLDIVLQNEKN